MLGGKQNDCFVVENGLFCGKKWAVFGQVLAYLV